MFLDKLKSKKIIVCIGVFIAGSLIGNLTAPMCSLSTHEGIEDKVNELEVDIKNKNNEITELKKKVDLAKPWFDMKEEEQKKLEEEKKAEEERQAEEQRQAKEEERKLKEEEEKKGYDTGIGYKDLARNPKDYVGKKVKFEGKVIQVMEGNGEVQIRLAVNGDYDNIIYCAYDSSIVSSRVLEDDYITVMGLSSDLITYKSTMGGEITIPSMLVQKIDM